MKHNIPFSDLKIIDLSTVLAGPSVGMFFAELGAKVIKIENAERPDITRSWKLPNEDKTSSVSAYFSSINYKKSYISLNLKEHSHRNKLFQWIPSADIVIMNYKSGDQAKLQLSDEQLRKHNSKLIIGKINGFGDDNDRVAYDLILQAESGMMSMNGEPGGNPVKMPVAFIDVMAAHHLKEGLLIELLQREKDKNYLGKTVSVSLYEAAVSSLVNQASNYLMNGHIPQRIGSLHPNIAPYGEIFETKDKRMITFAIGSNRHFKELCQTLGMEAITEKEAYSTHQNRIKNRISLFHLLQDKVKEFKADKLLQQLHSLFVPCGEIKDLQAVFEQPLAKNMVREEIIEGILTKRVSGIAFQIK